MLTLRAGGTLKLNGSVTDGFFTFGDQTDPAFLSQAGNSFVSHAALTVQGGCSNSNCNTGTLTDWSAYTSVTAIPAVYLGLTVSAKSPTTSDYAPFGTAVTVATPPYDAAANSPASQGSFTANTTMGNVAGAGDPIGSAELFPFLAQANGATRPVSSWSYGFAAGSDLAETPARLPSVNPMRADPAAVNGNFIVQGGSSYTYAHAAAGSPGSAIPDTVNVDGAVAYGLFTAPTAATGRWRWPIGWAICAGPWVSPSPIRQQRCWCCVRARILSLPMC